MSATALVIALAAHLGVVTHAAQQAVGDARRTTGTAGDLERAGLRSAAGRECRPNG
jgi:hypothetical protein